MAVSPASWDYSGNSNGEAKMDNIARGTASAALTLQSVILQALVYHGTMTPAEALEVVDKAVTAAAQGAKDKSQMEVANVARGCLEGVREAIAEMMN
jgi:20S proteasome alpha/beta subunit